VAAPDASPPGANDWSCQPSAAHPRPVVLVHGTVENQNVNWRALSPLLKNHGYCVFALNYGGSLPLKATGPVAASAGELSTFVDRVLSATGASKVDIVGHSQGGMMPRQYLRFLGGATKVDALVGLTPSNHGTTFNGILTLAQAIPGGSQVLAAGCPSCSDQTVGSAFLKQLNEGGDTVPGVRYTVITTKYDEVVTPYTSAFLSGSNVQNITVQDGCPIDLGEHLAISYDRRALAYVLNALDPAQPVSVPCVPVLPLVGG
jgi:triacylglycerol esterase/lipase EstA (alpha/beta hydrolase family)